MSAADAKLVDKAITDRAERVQEARDFYEGAPTGLIAGVGPALAKLLHDLRMDHVLRFAAVPVDTLLDRVRLRGLRAAGDGGELVERIWEDNELDHESIDALRWSMVDGDGYLLAWWRYGDDLEEGDDDEGEIEAGTAQITHLSPLEAHLVYDRQVPVRPRVGGRRWTDDGGDTRLDLYYPTIVERWVRRKDDPVGEWEPYGDDIVHDLGEVPLVHLRNRRPYGRPEHADAFGPQNIITQTAATMMATMVYRGAPFLAALSKPGSPTAGSGDFSILDEDDGAEKPTLRAMPGELWSLTADQLVQIDAADLAGFLATVNEVVAWMAALTATPVTAFRGWLGGEAPSGSALIRMEAPLTRRARSRQQQYGAGFEQAMRLAVRLAGGGDVEVVAEWEPAETADTLDALDVVAAKVDLGVPKRVALGEAGYSDEELDEWGVTLEAAPPSITAPRPAAVPVAAQIPGQLAIEGAQA